MLQTFNFAILKTYKWVACWLVRWKVYHSPPSNNRFAKEKLLKKYNFQTIQNEEMGQMMQKWSHFLNLESLGSQFSTMDMSNKNQTFFNDEKSYC